MNTKFFTVLFFTLLTSVCQTAIAGNGYEPSDIKIVVSAKKIWFIADEMPMKCLCVKVKDHSDKVVLEKCLNSKTADWSLNVESLPKGEYTLVVGKDRTQKFRR